MGQAPDGTVESNESDPQAQTQTLCECFQLTAQRARDEVALGSADTGVELTWSQYAARVRRLAGGLAALGVTRGDTVALMLTNRSDRRRVAARRGRVDTHDEAEARCEPAGRVN